ncbi:MAG: zinc ribbon domain-containing protein [Methanobacteriaceae archaeon]|nr:zinc ribbon domain-containing protein [Methanobacteriaceae archaeon]MDP3035389.1 zinc ribbon domain-containing protein [Methanobacteriaceae archaeon]MDP3622426.1 zinc ribbon domain-containing protein [Methanobacteriaceae archaeon]
MGEFKRKCSHCGSDNSYSNKFCLKCGRKLPESPIDHYGDFSKKNPDFYDNLKNKSNKDQLNKIKDKPKIKKEKPEGFRNWWKSKDFITKSLILVGGGVILFFILIGVIVSQLPDTATNETTNNSTVVPEESVINDNQEDNQQQKQDQIDEIENSKALKDSVEHLIQDGYSYDQATVRNIKVDELISKNEVIVSYDVDWIDEYGDTKTEHKTGVTFVKKDGKWDYPY